MTSIKRTKSHKKCCFLFICVYSVRPNKNKLAKKKTTTTTYNVDWRLKSSYQKRKLITFTAKVDFRCFLWFPAPCLWPSKGQQHGVSVLSSTHSCGIFGQIRDTAADFEIWSFFTENPGLTHWKKSRFMDPRQIFFKKFPNESVCSKTSPETLFRPPKGPGTKK